MLKSWRLGRVFGFPVEINLSFLLLLAVVFIAFGGVTGVLYVGIAFASVLLHELGHALVARRLDVHVAGIELSFFGGAAKMVDMPRSAKHEIAIAAAGPAVSIALAAIGLGLGGALHAPLLATIGWINLGLAIFNLIPALPMDGGRILRALLTYKVDFVRATDISVTVSRVVAVGFAILGLLGTYQLLLLAPLLWMMGTRERAMARAMGNPYAGYRYGGGRGLPRSGTFDDAPGPRGGGFYREAEIPVRRFTVRQVRGRLVIEAFK